MPDLERVYAAIAGERQARKDLDAYLRNAHMSRVERDDEHERGLRRAVELATEAVDVAIAERRREVAAAVDAYVPTEAAREVVQP